jgi:hypothetical protein
MPKAIPDRAPLGDSFAGVVLRVGGAQALALESHSGADVIASGTFTIRYGVRFLGKPYLSIVPGLLVLDYGDMMTGDEAWDFLLNRSNLYPRAEVVGYRSDGRDDMVFIRQLDLALPVHVLAYPDEMAAMPLAMPTALIAPDGAVVAPRVLQYLPRFDSVGDYLAARKST